MVSQQTTGITTLPTSLARDRIAQSYLGLWGGTEMQARSQRRINWMAGQVCGKRVLDIGCSEGILVILLGREGFEVTGVDVNIETLDYARELLAMENAFVQRRITLIHADLLAADLEQEAFDTVILGEVIEHLIKPEFMLMRAFSLLKSGGSLVLTTPFGFHPDPDHRQSFTLSRIVELLKPYCIPKHLFIEDNYIRFSGVKERPSPEQWASYDNTALLHIAEEASISKQYFLYQQINNHKDRSAKNNEALKMRQKELEDLKTTKQQIEQKYAELAKTKRRLEMHTDSFSYRLGHILIQAIVRPGFNTFALPYRLGMLLTAGLKTKFRASDPEVFCILLKLSDGSEKLIPFTINKPGLVQKEGDKIILSLPNGESAYLTSKENSLFSTPPSIDMFLLAPDTEYTFSGAINTDTSVTLWVIEYNDQQRIADHKCLISTGSFQFSFKTSSDLKRLCIAFRCTGKVSFTPLKSIWTIKKVQKAKTEIISSKINAKKMNKVMQAASAWPISQAAMKISQALKSFQLGKETISYAPRAEHSLYLLHSSLPWISNGYGTRSHGLLSAMLSLGMDVQAVTRLGFPVDFNKLRLTCAPEQDIVDHVTYLRLPTKDSGYGKVPLEYYLQQYIEAVVNLARQHRPALLHAASNYVNGLVAVHAAKILGIPSIYENRGLWEITRLSREPKWEFSEEYKMNVSLETDACREATAVIAITDALKNYLVNERGVSADKITVVPNGVNGNRFTPRKRDPELEAKFDLQGKIVIGFVGSFVGYEGLDLLMEAAALLRNRRDDFRLLLVGDGICLEDLQRQCQEGGLTDCVHFTGRVPHDQVEAYYSLIDITPFPRKGYLVCELVPPLKPFEAMAMEKTVVVSNVAALTEIVRNGKTGLIHAKDDFQDLARVLEILLDNLSLRQQLARAGREWVLTEQDWKHSAKIIQNLYKQLLREF